MKYKIGDMIRIKSRSELKKLPKYNKADNSIKVKPQFTSEMWHLCDEQYRIFEIISEYMIIKDEFDEEWMIADWMIKDAIDNKGNFLLKL